MRDSTPVSPVQVWRSERCDAPGFGRVWSLKPQTPEDRVTCSRRVQIGVSGLSKRVVLNTHRLSGRRVFPDQVAAKVPRRRNACELFKAECKAPPIAHKSTNHQSPLTSPLSPPRQSRRMPEASPAYLGARPQLHRFWSEGRSLFARSCRLRRTVPDVVATGRRESPPVG